MSDEPAQHPPHGADELPSICYAMAYFVLPRYAEGATERLFLQAAEGDTAALFFYLLTCTMDGKGPREDCVRSFSVHTGQLDEHVDYVVFCYPSPPPVNITGVPMEKALEAMRGVTLAPYFSAVLRNTRTEAVKYFVLGQSPDGRTTLRTVAGTTNANLGPGCVPELHAFLALLRERHQDSGPDAWRAAVSGPASPDDGPDGD